MNTCQALVTNKQYLKLKKCLKISFLVTMFLIVSLICYNIFAYTITNYKPTYGITNETVNFRSYPTTTSLAIKTLAQNTKVKMLGTINNFYIVQLSTNEVGLISKDYVKSSSSAPSGAKTYTAITKTTATITEGGVNFRRGPSTAFQSIGKFSKGDKVTVIGYIDSWYLVINNASAVGMVHKDYLSFTAVSNNTSANTTDSNVLLILDLINQARTAKGLAKLTLGVTSTKVAQLKAEDMVKSNYFSHTSPTFGSPFKMMATYGISYKAAGENIAGNPSIEAAVKSWLASSTHKQNLLSNSYNYIGIGIAKSNTYGYIIVAEFVGQ